MKLKTYRCPECGTMIFRRQDSPDTIRERCPWCLVFQNFNAVEGEDDGKEVGVIHVRGELE